MGASAGARHTVAWTEEGELYISGDRRLIGGVDSAQIAPHVSHAAKFTLLRSFLHFPESQEELPAVNADMKVVGAAAGVWHTVVWTAAGKVFTFGEASQGKEWHLGRGSGLHAGVFWSDRDQTPQLVRAMRDA